VTETASFVALARSRGRSWRRCQRHPATATHIPIPHAAAVETLVETLSHRQISVVGEEFAVSKDGIEMFGVLDLETGCDGCRFVIGTKHDVIIERA
ncbi:MAG TPA: hypothetical protein VFC29_20940, partial [Candidatus Limnocylindrales bacterium]|nr:hypothetical protein [Candidatus Limnocylindrales bacterium]